MTNQIRLFQPFMTNPERGQIKNCQLCNQKFGPFTKQHQCKRCYRAVCSNCGTTKRDVYKHKMQRSQHRLCKHCNIQSTIIIEYISINKLKFGQDSIIAKRWQDRIPISHKDSLNIKQHKKFTIQIFNQLWDSYNFSLRQFIGLLTYSMGQNEVYKLINTVYIQLQSRGIQQRMQNIIYTIIFILCFSSTDTCTQLIQYLYTLKKNISDQKQFLLSYLKSLGIQDNQSKKLIDFINYKFKTYLGSYSINSVTTQCSIHVISRAFQKNRIDQIFMLLAIILQDNWQNLIKNRSNKNQCDFIIIKNCNMSIYIDKFKKLLTVDVSQFSGARATLRNSVKLEKQKQQKQQKLQIKTQSFKQQKIDNNNNNNKSNNSKSNDNSPDSLSFKKRQSITLDIGNQYKNSIQETTMQTPQKQQEQNINFNFKLLMPLNKSKNNAQVDLDQDSMDGDQEQNRNRIKNQQINFNAKNISNNNIKSKQEIIVQDKNKKIIEDVKIKQQPSPPKKKTSNLYESQNLFAQLLNLQSPQKSQKSQKFEKVQKSDSQPQITQPVKQIQKQQDKKIQKLNKSPEPILKTNQLCKRCISNQQKLNLFQQKNKNLAEQLEKVKKQLKLSQIQIQKNTQQLQISQKSFKQLKNAQKSQSQTKQISMQQVINLKNRIEQSQQRQLNIMKQLAKYQKQNKNLKLQTEELSLNNRILKQKLQQTNAATLSVSSPTRNNNININITQNQDETMRINKMMQKTIQNKNKQLQILTIKNKQLIQKLTQLQKSNSTQNVRENQKTKQLQKQKSDLIIKMKELSDIVIKEQSQKLNLSQQLFELKQTKRSVSMIIQSSKDSKDSSTEKQVSMKSRVSDCVIF